jgi:hypothetical protein
VLDKLKEMKELEKKLKELQKHGYENIGINQILQWIAEIQRDARLARSRSNRR